MPDGAAKEVGSDVEKDRSARNRELRDLFVSITGSEAFTETQKQRSDSRYIVPEESLSEPVTAIAKADGLTDTFSAPEYEFEDE